MKQRALPPYKYKAVLFDLDGTLVDSFRAVFRLFNQVVASRLGRTFTRAEMALYFGPPEPVIIRELFPDVAEHQSVTTQYYRLLREQGHDIRAYAGIPELLRQLRAQGRHLAIYSSASTEAATIRAGHAGVAELFDEIQGADKVANYKPHPEGVTKLIEHFAVAPHEAIYIGDMPGDVAAGRDAGVATVAVTWGAGERATLAAAQPDFLTDDPKELMAILA